jgi:hypothetical protein
MKLFFIGLLVSILTACGGGTPEPVVTKRAIHVVLLGDSVTRQSGDTLLKHLPPGSSLDNRGLDGARASDFLTGRYGNLPLPWNPEFVYVVSFGANECLGGQPVSDLVDATKAIVEHGRAAGAKNFVIEAPWRVLHGINQCNVRIAQFREEVIKMAAAIGVPFALEFDTESIGDAVHITQRHNEIRAAELSRAIFTLPTFLK